MAKNYSKENINFMTWNLQGLVSSDGTNKLRIPEMLRIMYKFDFICLCETWQDNDDNISLHGYKQFTSHRSMKHKKARRSSGGVAVLVRNNISKGVTRVKSASDDIIWLKLDKKFFGINKDIYLCCCYLIPQNSSTFTWNDIDICDILDTEVSKYGTFGDILLCGDLNARTGNLLDYIANDDNDDNIANVLPLPPDYLSDDFNRSRNNRDPTTNEWGRFIVDLCISAKLCLLNGRTNGDITGKCTCFTRSGVSAVDLNIISKNLFFDVLYFKVMDFTIWSDHCPVSMALKINSPNSTNHANNHQNLISPPPKYKWNPDKKDKFVSEIANMSSELESFCSESGNSPSSANNFLSQVLMDAAKKSLRLVKSRPRKKKKAFTFTQSCGTIRKHLLYTKTLLENYPRNREIRESYYAIRRIYRKAIKKAKNDYRDSILKKLSEMKSTDPTEYWRLLNFLRECERPDHAASIPPDIWTDHFTKLFTPSYDETELRSLFHDLKDRISLFRDLDSDFTEKDIYDGINALKNNKCCGPDGIVNEMLKSAKYFLVKPLLKLFNLVLKEACVPAEWKQAHLTLIYKSGDKSSPNNYRGIAISSCLGKLFSKIMNNRLQNRLESNCEYTKFQCGFRKDHRTSDNIFILSQITRYYKSKGKKLYACFVDFQKAFDTVSRTGLFIKLINQKIGGNFLKTIKNMYENDSLAVKIGSRITKNIPCYQGVKQGDSLSSTLFNLFINDLPQIFNENNSLPAKLEDITIGCLLYADDLVILSESHLGLQNSLNKLDQYCQKWKLKINTSKTQIVIFNSKGSNSGAFHIQFDDNEIKIVSSYKYLGIIMHKSGKFHQGIETLSSKALKSLFCLQKALYSDKISPIDMQIKVFDSVIIPILTYCSEIWGQDLLHNSKEFKTNIIDDKSKIEVVHMRFCKRILGVPTLSSNVAVRSELGRMPIMFNIVNNVFKYYVRLESLHQNRLLKKVYEKTKNQKFGIKNIALHYGTLVSVKIEDLDLTDTTQCKRLMNHFYDAWYVYNEEEWYSFLNSGFGPSGENNKLRLYCKFKKNLVLENYLKDITDFHKRKNIVKLRISAHNLAIEKERNKKQGKTTLLERKCKYCNTKRVENEYHFIMHCPLYMTERQEFFAKLSISPATPPEETFINLMKCKKQEMMKEFTIYLDKIFTKRKLHNINDCDILAQNIQL